MPRIISSRRDQSIDFSRELSRAVFEAVAPSTHPDMTSFRIARAVATKLGARIALSGLPTGPRNDLGRGYSANRALVVEMLARALGRRATRAVQDLREPDAATWASELAEEFPRWFECEVSCGPGWSHLLHVLAERLRDLNPSRDFGFGQVKEKYGELCCYSVGADGIVGGVIEAAEVASSALCETCGAPGELWVDAGYYHTACSEHGRGGRARE